MAVAARHRVFLRVSGSMALRPQSLGRVSISLNDLNGAKRLNDWNNWNGLIPVMNGAKWWNPSIELRAGFGNGWNGLSVCLRSSVSTQKSYG
jgi:hypothetical protein